MRPPLLLPLVLLGCEPFGPGAADPEEPLGGGQLAVAPVELDFGMLSAGQEETADARFTAENVGERELVVVGLDHLVGDGVFWSDAPAIVTLDPGQAHEVTITFAPDRDGDFAAELLPNGTARVELTGIGEAPDLELGSDLLTLASSPLGCDDEVTLDLWNAGRETLVITDVALSGSEDLLLVDEPDRALAPGERTSVEVRFEPTSGGQHAASLTLESNDPGEPIASVAVEALGYEGGIVDERFAYRPEVAADLLWVVDSSYTTASRLGSAAASVGLWLEALDAGLVDWHQALVNHDASCQATESPWLSATSDDPAGELAAALLHVGQGGTELLELASAAVERTDAQDCLDGFLRDGAQLHVVLVSARGESSPSEVDDYLDALESRRAGELVVSSIVGDGIGGCAEADAANTATSRTGGYLGDLCTTPWSKHFGELASISRASAELPYEHELAYAPVPETLEVTVDGEPVDDWSLGDDGLTLTVSGGGGLDLGDEVDVHYVQSVPCAG